jgi:hypothetical protein
VQETQDVGSSAKNVVGVRRGRELTNYFVISLPFIEGVLVKVRAE